MPRVQRNIDDLPQICKRFVQVLEQHLGLSLNAASKLLGYSNPSTLYSVNACKCLPDLEKLLRLSQLKDSNGHAPNLDWIVTGRGSPMLDKEPIKARQRVRVDDFINMLSALPPEKLAAIKTLVTN